jgi:3-oxoacyl-[acyl-carrier-protein] synthase III
MSRAAHGEHRAVIAGVGQSQIGRRIYRDPLDLTIEASLRAIEDAGLGRADIDGIATYPGAMAVPPGFSGVGVTEVQDALRSTSTGTPAAPSCRDSWAR